MRKILSFIKNNNFLSSIIGSAVVTGFLRLADNLLPRLKLNLRIIDYIFLFFLLFIVIFVIIIYRKQKRIPISNGEEQSDTDLKKLRDDFNTHKEIFNNIESELRKAITEIRQGLSQIYSKAKKYEEIEPLEEYIFILEILGSELNFHMYSANLHSRFVSHFKYRNEREATLNFNMSSKWLMKRNFIRTFVVENDDIDEFTAITDEGFEFLKIAKIKLTETKKEEENSKKDI